MLNSQDFDLKRFGNIVEEIRKSKKIKKLDVRKNTGIHSDTLKFIEYGEKLPNTDTLARLSDYYGVSILNVLDECRYEKNEYIIERIKELDTLSYKNMLEPIENLRKELQSHIDNQSKDYPLRTIQKLHQLDLLMQMIKIMNKSDIMNATNSELIAIKALKIGRPNFDVAKFKSFYYSGIELRILLLLAFSLVRQEKNTLSIALTKHVIEILHKHIKSTPESSFLLLQAYFNLSYILYLVKEDNESIKIANLGIALSKNLYNIKFLPHLYFRKGVSEYYTDKKDYEVSFRKCIQSFDLLEEDNLKDQYLTILNRQFSIDITN